MNDWKERLQKKLALMNVTIEELFTPPFQWTEISIFLKAVIMVAEEFYPDSGSGATKLELVMEMWDYYDDEYYLVDKLDDLVDFREIFGKLLGGIVEQFDAMVIRALVEQYLIPLLVGGIFPHFKSLK